MLRAQQQYRMHQHNRHYQQQHPVLPNQYEYVRREHGFDYMPPSQYVPSRSMSEDSEDISAAPPIKIEVAGSDLSVSVVESFDVPIDRRHKTPVVRGKPVKTKSSSRRVDKEELGRQPPRPQHYRSSRKELEDDERKGKDYRTARGAESSHYKRDTPKLKSRTRSEPVYRDEDPSLLVESSPEMQSRSSRRGKTPKRQQVVDHRSEPDSPGYTGHSQKRGHRSHSRGAVHGGDPASIPRVPTAFSYHSEDSVENPPPETLRYGLEDEENEYRMHSHISRKPAAGWERNQGKDHSRRRHRQVDDLDQFTTPAYQSRYGREASSVPGRVIETPRDDRMDKHRTRRRSRDVREQPPLEMFEPPLGMEPVRPSGADDFDVELSIGPYADEAYYDDPRMEQGYFKGDSRHPAKGRTMHENKPREEKKKAKGILGRIRDSVLKEKVDKRDGERAWGQELREKGSIFEKSPGSFDTDMSPRPQYQLDVPSARVPYPYDENYYEQSMRMPSKHVAPGSVPPPRPHPRRESFDHRRTPPEDYMYDDGPELRLAQPSGKPFQTSRATTPTLRANPDHRQRYVAMNTSMSKHYRSQHQGIGTGGQLRGNQSPRLQYDPTQVNNTQRRKKFGGCY